MKIVIDKQLIEYKDEGHGSVVILLHGWGTNLHTFNEVVTDLVKNYRVVRIDFPGFGQSPNPISDWFVDDYAQLLKKLFIKLNITKAKTVIGHSFGGRVAIKAIAQGYINVDKLVLIDSAGVKPNKSVKSHIYKYIAKSGKLALSLIPADKLKSRLKAKLYKSAGSSDYLHSGQLKKTFLNVINEDLLGDVSKIDIPTLLIWGENDTDTPVSDARKMLELLSNGSIHVIPNAGHFAYLDQSSKVNNLICEFIT